MSCNCILNETFFIYDVLNNPNDIVFTKNLLDIIPQYDVSLSGIWRPVFWNKKPEDNNGQTWEIISTVADPGDTPIVRCTGVSTPEGLGIRSFARIYNPKLKNWIANNVTLDIDWIVNFEECKTYSDTILMWYRYYDINRNPDKRFLKGIDLYISDGDFATISGLSYVSDNLQQDAALIKNQLMNLGYGTGLADRNAKILSTGPQIDWITLNLTNKTPTTIPPYNRNDYGQMIPFLSGMSLKKYTDIGKNNFISSKIDLVRKLAEKNGVNLTIPENTEASLVSKFTSKTGPNISIDLNGDLYRYSKDLSSGFDISVTVGDLQFKAARTNETYVPPPHISFEFIDGQNKRIEKQSKPHHINHITLNNNIIGFNLTHAETGVFSPHFDKIKFHGLGGVSLVGGIRLGESCDIGAVSLDPSGNPIYNNDTAITGPYFLQNYSASNQNSLEQSSQPIIINIKTHQNSQYRLAEKIKIDYLRSDNKPECEPFVSNDSCNCFPLKRLYPDASGRESLDNSEHLLYTPNTSLFYIPSGTFYANLSGQKVAEYGLTLPNHPAPLTPFPKIHKNLFPIDGNCVYTMNGCGDKVLYYDFPYPGKIQLSYQSPSGNFKMSWGEKSIENNPPKFATTAGSICLDKTSAEPAQVMLQIKVPADAPNTNWGISISGNQDDYSSIARLVGLGLQGSKGFFHPNFGWTSNAKYHNKSPLVPFHRGLFYKKKFNNNLGGYRISIRYGHEESSGSPCWGGHVCDAAKFDIIVNDIYIGTANLNNGGGPEDPGPEGTYDRASTFTIPSAVKIREGNRLDILIKCAYSYCHGGIAWVQIINNRGQIVFDECIDTEQLVTLFLSEPENNYFYNSYAMYDEEYLPGYNYMFNTSGLSDIQKNTFRNAAFVGIKVPGGNSYYIAKEWNLTKYTPSESLILEQVPFEYINMDYTYGYAYNDFIYEKIANNKIEVLSSTNNDQKRAANYVDHPSHKQTQLALYKYDDIEQKQIVNVTQASGNTFTLSSSLQEGFEKGFLFKNQDNQSVLVYRPHVTKNDPHITIGKWGNMSYGEAAIEASKYFEADALDRLRRYNNSSLRTGISANTSLSWSSPIKFINNYDFDNGKRYYFPLARLFDEWSYNGRVVHTLGYDNKYTDPTPTPSGDRIIASGSIKDTVGYLYCGSYVGPLELAVTLSDNSATKGNINIFHNNVQIATKSIAIKTNNNVLVNFNKQSEQPIYLRVELEDLTTQCFGLQNSNPSSLTIKDYKVTINQSNAQLRNKSRISYYAHKPSDPSALNLKSFAAGYPNQELLIDKIKASPINISEKYLEEEKTKDFSPFLDLHIFSASTNDMPITQQSGYIFFEDFLQPKTHKYIASGMEVSYDENKYWINLNYDKDWNILTSKGILLESNKRYKVLKTLKYNCSGEAEQCSKRYPKDICNIDYNLSIEEVFETLGMSGNDIDLFDVKTISMPKDCNTIDYCCDSLEFQWQKNECLSSQTYARENCVNAWNNKEYKTSCVDTVCPTGNITGVIGPTAEYFVLQLKDKIQPSVLADKEASFYFFGSSDNLNIPCTNISFPTIGSTFLYNYECKVDNPCNYITLPDYTINSSYVPGEMLDLSPFVLNDSIEAQKPVPSSVIFANEEKYRSIIPHERVINPPFYEYDPLAESRYGITHTFNIKSKKCVGAGALFSLGIDDWNCSFSIEAKPSGLILKSCFEDILLKPSGNINTITANGQLVEGEFTCGGTPSTYGMTSCGQAEEYIPQDAELIDCEELSTEEDYSYSCNYCAPSCGGTSISYQEPLAKECFCPGWINNLQNVNGADVCTGNVDNWFCDLQGDCNNGGYTVEVKNNPQQNVIGAYCFPAVAGPTKEQLDAYENHCPEIPANLWQENVIKTYSYQRVDIPEEYNPVQQAELTKTNIEVGAKAVKDFYNAGCTVNQCYKNCAGIEDNEQRQNCECNCVKTQYNTIANIQKNMKFTVDCVDYCGEYDILFQNGWFGCAGWWTGNQFPVWFGYDCTVTSSSWASKNGQPAECWPETGCGYKACSDIEKRFTIYANTYKYSCPGFNVEVVKEPIQTQAGKTITQTYTHKQRKVTNVTKTKSLSTKNLYDPANGFFEKVKVYNKSFKIQYKDKDEEECSEEDQENECCDKTNLDLTITADIFHNIMNIKLTRGSTTDNICIERNTNNLFKCPVITYNRSNEDIYICDNVTSSCSNCNTGKLA
jgi:hypothetical protein